MVEKKPNGRLRLTDQTLQELKEKGYQYVLVKDYTPDWHLDHIELNQFILVPVMQLPIDPGIYAPIDSEVLMDWVRTLDATFEAYIQMD